ncbi:MAG: hypothetical protein DSY83_13225 [Flavobacteriia bacterium]|nr:MAG: hypothetical protein DSY83_13225 [Flavobacteriia bacterium]
MEGDEDNTNSSVSTVEMAPAMSFFRCVPYPTTTTSSKMVLSGAKEMLTCDCWLIRTSWVR